MAKGIEGAGGGTGCTVGNVRGAVVGADGGAAGVFELILLSTPKEGVVDETRFIIFDAVILESEFELAVETDIVGEMAVFELLSAVYNIKSKNSFDI